MKKVLSAIFCLFCASLVIFSSCAKNSEYRNEPPQYEGFEYYTDSVHSDEYALYITDNALEKSDGETTTVLAQGVFDKGFAIRGDEIFAYNTEKSELWAINIADGSYSVRTPYDVFDSAKKSLTDYPSDNYTRSIIGAYEHYIYFNEYHKSPFGFVFVLDTTTGEYYRTKLFTAAVCKGYNGSIYYLPFNPDYNVETLYKCDPSLKKSEPFLEEILYCDVHDMMLYYVQVSEDDLTDAESLATAYGINLDSDTYFTLGTVTTHKALFAKYAYANLGLLAGTDKRIVLVRSIDDGEIAVDAVNCFIRDGVIFTQQYIPDSTSMECKYITQQKTYTFLCDSSVMYRLRLENGQVYYTDDNGNRVYIDAVCTDTIFDYTNKTSIAKYGIGE